MLHQHFVTNHSHFSSLITWLFLYTNKAKDMICCLLLANKIWSSYKTYMQFIHI